MKDYDAELRGWAFHQVRECTVVVGRVFSDSKGRWPDGHVIRTSALKTKCGEEGDVVVTRNTRYLLSGPPMTLDGLQQYTGGKANQERRAQVADDERLFDLLQAAWGMDDPTFETVAGLPQRWLWQWRNHYRAPTDNELAGVRRLARFHDALRIASYDAPTYTEFWRTQWDEGSLIGARSPLEAVLEDPSMLDRLETYFWAQM